MPNSGRLGFRPSKLSNRDRMLILNFKGVSDKHNNVAFCRLLGREEDDYLFDLSTADLIRLREKLRRSKWGSSR